MDGNEVGYQLWCTKLNLELAGSHINVDLVSLFKVSRNEDPQMLNQRRFCL